MFNVIAQVSAQVRPSFPRFSAELVVKHWSDITVDEASVRDGVRIFPSAAELRERGVNVDLLADCIDEGLIRLDEFDGTLRQLGVGLSLTDLNASFEHLLEGSEARRAHPGDRLDRAMHLQGTCGCKHNRCAA